MTRLCTQACMVNAAMCFDILRRRMAELKKAERAALLAALIAYVLPTDGHEGYAKASATTLHRSPEDSILQHFFVSVSDHATATHL